MVTNIVRIFSIFIVSLLVACGGSNSSTTDLSKTPIANIELGQSIIVLDDSITISGKNSENPNGDTLSYEWLIKNEAGEEYPLVDKNAETFVFTPEYFGVFQVTLIVRDSLHSSVSISATITVEPNEQSYPVAVISDDMNDKVGSVSWFTAENSIGSGGQLLTYQWQVWSKPPTSESTIEDADQVKAYLITDVAGTYEVALKVTNSENKLTASKKLTITAKDLLINSSPNAAISTEDVNFAINDIVKLNASQSYDSDDDFLTYQWVISEKPVGSIALFAEDTTEFVEFLADVEGEYLVSLTVSDESLSSEQTQMINVTSQNIAPIADAGVDQEVLLNAALELDGSASSDAEGEVLLYRWSLVSKPVESNYTGLSDTEFTLSSKFDFIADVAGSYVLALQVDDGIDYSAIDQLHITVTENELPVATLLSHVLTNSSEQISIFGDKSYDPEEQVLKYFWQIISAPDGFDEELLTGPNEYYGIATISPTILGTYIVQLIVNDGVQDSLPATITITRKDAEQAELIVTGQLVDTVGKPLEGIKVLGRGLGSTYSNDKGEFTVFYDTDGMIDPNNVLLSFGGTDITTKGRITLPKPTSEQPDVGIIKIPVMQRKDISLKACDGYSGSETIQTTFLQTSTGYENITFLQSFIVDLTLNEAPVEVKLPATGELTMHISALTEAQISGESFFTHQYQADDTQVDPLVITVCNLVH